MCGRFRSRILQEAPKDCNKVLQELYFSDSCLFNVASGADRHLYVRTGLTTPYRPDIGGWGEIKMASASTPSANEPAKDLILVHTVQPNLRKNGL